MLFVIFPHSAEGQALDILQVTPLREFFFPLPRGCFSLCQMCVDVEIPMFVLATIWPASTHHLPTTHAFPTVYPKK